MKNCLTTLCLLVLLSSNLYAARRGPNVEKINSIATQQLISLNKIPITPLSPQANKSNDVKKLLEELANVIKRSERVINKEFKPIAPKFKAWKTAIPLILKSKAPEEKGLPLLRDVWKTLPQAYAYFTTTRSRSVKSRFTRFHKNMTAKKSLVFSKYTPYKAVKLSPAEIDTVKQTLRELEKQLKAKTELTVSLKNRGIDLNNKMRQELPIRRLSKDAALVEKLNKAAVRRKGEISRTQTLLLKAQKDVETLQNSIAKHSRDLDAQKDFAKPQKPGEVPKDKAVK